MNNLAESGASVEFVLCLKVKMALGDLPRVRNEIWNPHPGCCQALCDQRRALNSSHKWQSTLIDSIHLLLLSSFHSSVFACDCLLEKAPAVSVGLTNGPFVGAGCRVSFFSFA